MKNTYQVANYRIWKLNSDYKDANLCWIALFEIQLNGARPAEPRLRSAATPNVPRKNDRKE